MSLGPVLNQVIYPGAGPLIDDCAILSAFMCSLATVPFEPLPTIAEFRAAAGRKDGGLNPDQKMAGIRGSWERMPAWHHTGLFDGLKEQLADGRVASVAVWSAALPAEHRYGFMGAHEVALEFNSVWRIANPLAKNGSKPKEIAEHEIERAMLAYTDPRPGVRAIVFGNAAEVREAYALSVYHQIDTPGQLIFPARTACRILAPREDGLGFVQVATRPANPNVSTPLRFGYRLDKMSGPGVARVLPITAGGFAGKFVVAGDVSVKYDPPPDPDRIATLEAQLAAANGSLAAANNRIQAARSALG